jgi:hypothetical protein
VPIKGEMVSGQIRLRNRGTGSKYYVNKCKLMPNGRKVFH